MRTALGVVDAAVVVAYLAAILGMSWFIARRQRTGTDYFLAGRTMAGPLLALSIVANQVSAISLIGAPAFVALRPGGGLSWLQYELALPLAMLAAIAVLVPVLRRVTGPSIYEFAEQRFGTGTRQLLSAVFLLSRGLALGVALYASALVVTTVLGWPVDLAILAIGLFALVYTGMGGIVADIWSDVLQLGVLWGGTILAALYVFLHYGMDVVRAIPLERSQVLVFGPGTGPDGTFDFWPMLLGGFFLYLSYYACDQSQAQRLLAARSEGEARRSLLINGLLRFPLVLTYCLLGLLLAGLLALDTGFAAQMDGRPADSLVPVFLMQYLPVGLRGIMLAGLLAAAMSSIDSAMNSLAAVTLEDVLRKDPANQPAFIGRITSVGWGLFAVASAMVCARSGAGVLELVNLIGSAFYGPILAVFILGAMTDAVDGRGAVTGLGAGLLTNLLLSQLMPTLSWLWWNPAGFLAAVGVALVVTPGPVRLVLRTWPRREARWLVPAFLSLLVLLPIAPRLLTWFAGL
jgi:SSS family transporter